MRYLVLGFFLCTCAFVAAGCHDDEVCNPGLELVDGVCIPGLPVAGAGATDGSAPADAGQD